MTTHDYCFEFCRIPFHSVPCFKRFLQWIGWVLTTIASVYNLLLLMISMTAHFGVGDFFSRQQLPLLYLRYRLTIIFAHTPTTRYRVIWLVGWQSLIYGACPYIMLVVTKAVKNISLSLYCASTMHLLMVFSFRHYIWGTDTLLCDECVWTNPWNNIFTRLALNCIYVIWCFTWTQHTYIHIYIYVVN